MCRSCRTVSLGFTSEAVAEGGHICYIFDDEDERRETMSRFLGAGIDEREKVLAMVDTMSTDEYVDNLDRMGLQASKLIDGFIVAEATNVYCSTGAFSMSNTLKALKEFYCRAKDEGYCGARVTGEMSWALQSERTTMRRLIEYESRVNNVLNQYPITAVCQYDSRLFDRSMIMDVLQVHPLAIIHGQIVKNPLYVEPPIFLQKLENQGNA